MKYLLSLLTLFLIFSCENSIESSENEQEQNPESLEVMDKEELNEAVNEVTSLINEMRVASDTTIDSDKKSFKAFEGVERKTDNTPLNFNTYAWEDQFDYTFPESPGFEKFEKDDHDSYAARTLVDGIIYEVAIEDYEKLGADKVDAGFTKYIHDEFISNFSDEILDSYEIKTSPRIYGFSSCYRYEMKGRVYLADIVTFGFQDKMVRFLITAKNEYENALRVKEFVSGLEVHINF